MLVAIVTGVVLCLSVALSAASWRSISCEAFVTAKARARLSILLSILAAPLGLATAVGGSIFAHGATSKATALGRGISESMNIGAFHIPVMLASIVAWATARRKKTPAN